MAGFTNTKTNPKNLINDLRKNIKELTPQNLDETVMLSRLEWDEDYGNRSPKAPLTRKELLEPETREWFAQANPEGGWADKKQWSGTKRLFAAMTDHWMFCIIQFPSGKKEFCFNVMVGKTGIWHTGDMESYLAGGLKLDKTWKHLTSGNYLQDDELCFTKVRGIPGL